MATTSPAALKYVFLFYGCLGLLISYLAAQMSEPDRKGHFVASAQYNQQSYLQNSMEAEEEAIEYSEVEML